jgi:hypothetical protein
VPILPTPSRGPKGAMPDLTGGIRSEIHFANTVPMQTQIQCSQKSCWKA